MKKIWTASVVCLLLLAACGQSYEETKRITRQQRREAMRRDSAALKIAVMPTLDCLPLLVAQQEHLFDTIYGGVRLKYYKAQMDCDTALLRRRAEGMVTDLVRAKHIEQGGMELRYPIVTNAYWQLVSNRNARIHQLRQLDDKMIAMTRHSATDMLTDLVADSAKLKDGRVFKVQVNDVHVRFQMLQNNELDALWFTEPQATSARLLKHAPLYDTREADLQLGVIAFNETEMRHPGRAKQLALFVESYNKACDLINRHGMAHYRDLLMKRCKLRPQEVDSLPPLKYQHAQAPRQHDIEVVEKWLEKVKSIEKSKRGYKK